MVVRECIGGTEDKSKGNEKIKIVYLFVHDVV